MFHIVATGHGLGGHSDRIEAENKELNNWFLKMAIINTIDDLKIFLNNLKKNKNKCIIAIYGNEIIGYLNIFPL